MPRFTLKILVLLVLTAKVGAETELQAKMRKVKLGMTRETVISVVGSPDWAIIPSDSGDFTLEPEYSLELLWQSQGCAPALVAFDHTGKVVGWNEGRICFKGAKTVEPTAEYACSKEDRKKYCSTTSPR